MPAKSLVCGVCKAELKSVAQAPYGGPNVRSPRGVIGGRVSKRVLSDPPEGSPGVV